MFIQQNKFYWTSEPKLDYYQDISTDWAHSSGRDTLVN